MEDILKLVVTHGIDAALSLVALVGSVLLAFISARIKAKLGHELFINAYDKLSIIISPLVIEAWEKFSKDIKAAAKDGVITKEEANKALAAVQEDILARIKATYPELLKALHPDLQKAEQIIRSEIEAVYVRLRNRLFSSGSNAK